MTLWTTSLAALRSKAAGNAAGAWRALASLKLTIACLAALMVLVAACTVAQVRLGTFGAVAAYIRPFFVYWRPEGAGWKIPVFPGGGLLGLLLLFNLAAAQASRLELSWRKAGLWFVHLGLLLLFVGEFVTGIFQVDAQMAIEEGRSLNYTVSAREDELVVADLSSADSEEVFSVAGRRLRAGKELRHPRWPFSLRVRSFFANADVGRRPEGAGIPPSLADQGLGSRLVLQPMDPVTRDDARNRPAAFVELFAQGRSLGTWLLSSELDAPQEFSSGGRRYSLALRPLRRYLPFTLALKDFRHDRYAGTDIPRNFSSTVRLIHPERGEDRELIISMNQPLRYGGRTFYQASFGKEETLSVLQVVENPGWLLPYLSCALVGFGLLAHFGTRLKLSLREARA